MTSSRPIDRRAFLQASADGRWPCRCSTPWGRRSTEQIPRRFCALYTANGMSLPRPEHGIDEWSWFPTAEKDGQFVLRQIDRAARSVPQAAQLPGRAAPSRAARRPTRTCAPTCGSPGPRCTTRSPAPTTRSASTRSSPCTRSNIAGSRRWCCRSTRAPASSRGPARSPTASKGGRSRRRTTRGASSTACSAATASRCKSEREQVQRQHQARGRRRRECEVAQPAARQVRPRADGPVPDLAQRGRVAADRLREVDRHPAEEAGLLASQSRRDQRGEAGRLLPHHVRPDRPGVRCGHHAVGRLHAQPRGRHGHQRHVPAQARASPTPTTTCRTRPTRRGNWRSRNTTCS